MKALKYIFRFLLFLVVGIVAAAIIVPIVFKDDIVASVKEVINENINAEVDFADVDLSLISTFPNAGISITDLAIAGVDHFEGIPLASINKLTAEVSLPSLISKTEPLEVVSITVANPILDIRVLEDGRANYDIVQPTATDTETEGDFIMNLEKYEIINGVLSYHDKASHMRVSASDIDHAGSGNFRNEKFDVATKTSMSNLNVSMEGTNYLTRARAEADATIAVDLATGSYTLKENTLSVNAMDVHVDGYVQVRPADMMMDLTFATPNENAKSIMSIIPGVYTANFDDVKAEGTATFSGKVKGLYNGQKGIMPAIDLKTSIKDGKLRYPALPKEVSEINVAIDITAEQGNYDDMVVNIPTFALRLGDNPISGQLVTSNVSRDPQVAGMLQGTVKLEDWKDALPASDIEQLGGTIIADVKFAGKQSDVIAERYGAITFAGDFTGKNINYKAADMPAIKMQTVTSDISPKSIKINTESLEAGRSDARGTITIDNPLAYFLNEGVTTTTVAMNSKLLDANEWMSPAIDGTETESMSIPEQIANVNLDLAADQVVFQTYEIKAMKLQGEHKANSMNVDHLSGVIGSSDFTMTGELGNTLGYFNDGEILTGDLTLRSRTLVMEDFMSEEPVDEQEIEIIAVPPNMAISISADVDKAMYDDITLQQLRGDIAVEGEEAVLEDGRAKALGGNVKFAGMYGTSGEGQPDFSFKYDLSKLDFKQTFEKVNTVQSLTPIMKYLQGTFNSTMVMDGKLGDDMLPQLSSLNASGFLETIAAQLQKIDVANKLADKLGIEELRKLDLDHTKNWFEIKEGTVELKPVQKKIAGIDMNLSGTHGLNSDMNYQILMDVPRDMLKGNVVTGAVEKGLGLLESEAAKLGVNINQGDFIKLKVILTGSLVAPSIKIVPLGSGGQATAKDVVDATIDEIKQTVKDSVKTVIDDTKQTIKDTVASTVNTAKDSVNTVIDKTVKTATDSAKTIITTTVQNQVDKVLKDSAAQAVKDEVNDIIKDNTGEAVDDIKEKLDDWNPFKKKKKKEKDK